MGVRRVSHAEPGLRRETPSRHIAARALTAPGQVLSESGGESACIGLRISWARKADTIGRVNRRLIALIANFAALCVAADLSPGVREAAAALQRGDFAAAETKL